MEWWTGQGRGGIGWVRYRDKEGGTWEGSGCRALVQVLGSPSRLSPLWFCSRLSRVRPGRENGKIRVGPVTDPLSVAIPCLVPLVWMGGRLAGWLDLGGRKGEACRSLVPGSQSGKASRMLLQPTSRVVDRLASSGKTRWYQSDLSAGGAQARTDQRLVAQRHPCNANLPGERARMGKKKKKKRES